MLVISRKSNETIKIGNNIEIKIISIDKNQVKIGIEAPNSITILRGELIEKIKEENKKASKLLNKQILLNEIKKVFK
jgi:carbon storage regulator